jgi:hypothetical protein
MGIAHDCISHVTSIYTTAIIMRPRAQSARNAKDKKPN